MFVNYFLHRCRHFIVSHFTISLDCQVENFIIENEFTQNITTTQNETFELSSSLYSSFIIHFPLKVVGNGSYVLVHRNEGTL